MEKTIEEVAKENCNKKFLPWAGDDRRPAYISGFIDGVNYCTNKDKEDKKTPEELIKQGFENLSKTRELFGEAFKAYNTRSDFTKADPENAANIKSALHYLAAAYDEVSAIWENDINV